jgi:AraC-like DNA-binding protein
MTQFADFINQIPEGVLQKTEILPCSNIVLFKPRVYLGGIKLDVTDYHVVMTSENTPDVLFNNKIIHAGQRNILTVNPGDTVTFLKKASAKPYYSFLIKPGLLHKIADEMGFSGDIRFEDFLNPFSAELFQTFKYIERESSRPDRLNLMLDSLEIQTAVLLLRKLKTNIKINTPLFKYADSYIQSAMEYMQANFNLNVTLQDICEEIHVSHYHFIRMFRQNVGITPHRYLLNIRIEKAKELLDTNHYSVAETAVFCGFESITHFSSTFKKSTGYSPFEYKKR